jgi:hypothetical protein
LPEVTERLKHSFSLVFFLNPAIKPGILMGAFKKRAASSPFVPEPIKMPCRLAIARSIGNSICQPQTLIPS